MCKRAEFEEPLVMQSLINGRQLQAGRRYLSLRRLARPATRALHTAKNLKKVTLKSSVQCHLKQI